MSDDLIAAFELELKRRGLVFERLDRPDLYRVHVSGPDLTVNLENRRRNAVRDSDTESMRRYVDDLVRSAHQTGNGPARVALQSLGDLCAILP